MSGVTNTNVLYPLVPAKAGTQGDMVLNSQQLDPLARGAGEGVGAGNMFRSFPHAKVGFTRCWPYCVRKSARDDCDGGPWATINEDKLVLLDSRLRGNERSDEH